ncbi:methyltransferase, TIGR04325 family [Paenibacillus humicola]|uniref:methyltransferase, TIGR04325 family n=1 Tax=Paenibacillus humicola TaxID=3110540 RepID=UPI00237A40F6|nr:methyltransferase, TIGR04325 family [Paenibacillus humicola]
MDREHGLFGSFSSWSEAMQYYAGDPDYFLEKVKEATLKVKSGEAAFERDSVLFDKIQHSYPLLAYLLMIATEHGNKLNVLDLGGSLGSSYFQCRGFLKHLNEIKWNIVEQEHYVACGRKYIQDEILKFYYSIDECVAAGRPHTAILSGVLLALDDPYAYLYKLMDSGFDYIIIDRTPFLPAEDRLTLYVIPPYIHESITPVWLLSLERFLSVVGEKYEVMDDFDSFESYPLEDGLVAQAKGFLLRKIPAAPKRKKT